MTSPRRTTRVTWVMLFLVVAAVWSILDVRHRMIDSLDSGNIATTPSTANEPAAVAVTAPVLVPIDDDAVAAKRPLDRELEAANWRNPFALKWWHAPEWNVVAGGLRGTGRARFRKPFTGVSLSLVVEAADDSVVPVPSIRLANANENGSSVVVRWYQHVVSVSRERRGHSPRTIRELDLPPAIVERESPHRRQLQLVVTGNRLVIAESRKRLIFCDRPSEISAGPFFVAFDAGDQVLTIRELRMDGE